MPDAHTGGMDLSELVVKTLARRRRASDPLRIVQAGHPALRGEAREWTGQLDDELLAELVQAMVVTMRDAPGVGLAAPQIGIPLQLVVLEDPVAEDEADAEDDVLRRHHLPQRTFLNPAYAGVEPRRVYYWEGCLSVDDWQSIVPRHLTVDASALERHDDGTITPMAERWTGWSARIFQHETDHLAGTLCHDRCVPRSYVRSRYTERYADLPDAVRWLRLEGEVATLSSGEVEIG